MIHLVFCVRRLEHLDDAEFHRYWRDEHGPLVRSLQGDLGIHRYVQAHTIATPLNDLLRAGRGATEGYDGVAELWWEGDLEAFQARISTPEGLAAGQRLLEDEARFIDLARSSLFLADDHEVLAAPTAEIEPIGWVVSPLAALGDAPCQGDEGAPDATIELRPELLDGIAGLQIGDRLVVLTWLDRGDRTVRTVHPRGDRTRPAQGVFGTRSPDRPNPIGLHEVELLGIDGPRLRVGPIEAIDGTPVIDIKPSLGAVADR